MLSLQKEPGLLPFQDNLPLAGLASVISVAYSPHSNRYTVMHMI